MNANILAPVTIFTFNRLLHLQQTINSLRKNDLAKNTDLIIFSDGANDESNQNKVIKIREYLEEIKGFKKIIIIKRKKNFGLAKNIILGVSAILKKYKKIIVLEDDLIVNKYFLKYMNSGLDIYKKNNNVASIHGYVYPIQNLKKKINSNTFFLKGADCWGWGTWQRSWKNFDKNGKRLLHKIDKKKLVYEFNLNNSYDYYQMLKNQVLNRNNSWAIRWHASCFLKNMLTLYPSQSLVKNIGLDNSGINSKYDWFKLGRVDLKNYNLKIKKQKVKESKIGKEFIINFLRKKKFFFFKNIIKKIFDV